MERHRHIHTGRLDSHDRHIVDGAIVTTAARTAVDIACSVPDFARALAVFDSALRREARREAMAEMLTERAGRKGVPVARRALSLADAGADNPGESWCRAQLIEAGLPVPTVQYRVCDANGDWVATCDLGWDGRVVGEFDGFDKYQRYLRPGERPMDVLKREKLREDAIRRTGTHVVRWVWDDLTSGAVAGIVSPWLQKFGIVP